MVRNLLMFYTNNSLKPKDITERSSKSSPMNVLHICFRKVTTVTTVTLLAWAFITVRHWISHWAVIYLSAGVFMHTQKIYKYAKKTTLSAGKGVNVTCCCFLSFFSPQWAFLQDPPHMSPPKATSRLFRHPPAGWVWTRPPPPTQSPQVYRRRSGICLHLPAASSSRRSRAISTRS